MKIIVVGAGAAGLMAATEAAKSGAEVILLEKKERVGRKIRITGKGRCNLTNVAPLKDFLSNVYDNKGRFLRQSFSYFFSEQLIELFENLNVPTITERGGRVFPKSEKAEDIADALLKYNLDENVEIRYHCNVNSLLVENGKIKGVSYLQNNEHITEFADAVIIATGGKSYPATGSTGDGYYFARKTGHTIENPRPSLVPLETSENYPMEMQGLSLKNVNATLWVNGKKNAEQFGEMLFTHFGVSGPIILSLSRFAVDALKENQKVTLQIDLKPALDLNKLDLRLLKEIENHGKKQFKALLKVLLPSKMIPVFCEILKICPDKICHQITANERKSLRNLLKNFPLTIKNHRSFKEAIVTAGGVSTKDVNPKTLESRKIENLYFAGEVLDVDAKTGGYNLQIAFSTGKFAGYNAVKKLKNQG